MPEAAIGGLTLLLSCLWVVPVGVAIGIFVGAMPGLTATNSLAMLLPVLITMPPEQGLILGVSLYAGAEVGNSFPAILLNIPGTASSSVTAMEGYPLAKRGLGAMALGICIMGSTLGALLGGIVSIIGAPLIATVALEFSPVEICITIVFGIAVIAQLSTGGLVKGLLAGFLGLLLATTGTDPTYGQFRSTFGLVNLFDGITVIAALVGLLGFSEALLRTEEIARGLKAEAVEAKLGLREVFKGFRVVFSYPFEVLRASVVGLFIGAVPGAGASVASFVAYQQALSSASPEERKEFGKGSIRGLLAADTSNNANVGGSIVPLLTIGIPGSASMAVLLAVMGYHGLAVGPRLFSTSGDIAYAVLWSQFAATFFVLVLGTLLAYAAYRAALINIAYIVPVITVLSLLGGFSHHQAVFDMGLVVLFGAIGYIMKKYDYPVVALLLGLMLGQMFEANLYRGMLMGFGSPEIFFTRPVAQILWVLLIATLFGQPLWRWAKARFGGARPVGDQPGQ